MRGARLLLGTAVAGNRMAAATESETESEAINVAEQRIFLLGADERCDRHCVQFYFGLSAASRRQNTLKT